MKLVLKEHTTISNTCKNIWVYYEVAKCKRVATLGLFITESHSIRLSILTESSLFLSPFCIQNKSVMLGDVKIFFVFLLTFTGWIKVIRPNPIGIYWRALPVQTLNRWRQYCTRFPSQHWMAAWHTVIYVGGGSLLSFSKRAAIPFLQPLLRWSKRGDPSVVKTTTFVTQFPTFREIYADKENHAQAWYNQLAG